MNIGFLGVGKIALEHSKVVKALEHKIILGCATSQDSKNWKTFKLTNPDVHFESDIKNLLYNPKIDAVISCLPWDVTEKWLPLLLTTKKPVLIEKPMALSSLIAEKIINQNNVQLKNKVIGFNRRFYEPVQKLKKRIEKGGLKSVEITISETLDRLIQKYGEKIVDYIFIFSSSHILDTAIYLFGQLKPIKFYKYKDEKSFSLTGILETEKKIPLIISINMENPTDVGIKMYFDDKTTWHLSPMECLTVYKGYETTEPNKKIKIREYKPKIISKTIVDSEFKPGFLKQMEAFITQDKNICATPKESIKLLQFIEDITKNTT